MNRMCPAPVKCFADLATRRLHVDLMLVSAAACRRG
ncbi:hypothetical protein FHU37_004271 [Allostreptomyces psammosilenae]|uniref:Uncharacterized protein n=1 Tax=Allostreptomyces psammosilenae TaxID=1892865 RepID=A0A853A9Z0_9ACTN|nr:hypothetical protein [Allostreptomyces psammosilenae]